MRLQQAVRPGSAPGTGRGPRADRRARAAPPAGPRGAGTRGLSPVLDDDARRRAVDRLLAGQRCPGDQGATAAVLDDDAAAGPLRALVDDAVDRQLPDGRLAGPDPACALDGAAVGEFVERLARRHGDPVLAAAAAAQRAWLLHGAPRAADGTVFARLDGRLVRADSISPLVPPLVVAGEAAAALAQLAGHRRRLRQDRTGLWATSWDEGTGRLADPRARGTGNGRVVTGLARSVRWLPAPARTAVAGEVQELLEACLALRRPDGLVGEVLDDPAAPGDATAGAMLACAALTGAAEGWLADRWRGVGAELLTAVLDRVGGPRPGCSLPMQAFLLLADTAARRLRV